MLFIPLYHFHDVARIFMNEVFAKSPAPKVSLSHVSGRRCNVHCTSRVSRGYITTASQSWLICTGIAKILISDHIAFHIDATRALLRSINLQTKMKLITKSLLVGGLVYLASWKWQYEFTILQKAFSNSCITDRIVYLLGATSLFLNLEKYLKDVRFWVGGTLLYVGFHWPNLVIATLEFVGKSFVRSLVFVAVILIFFGYPEVFGWIYQQVEEPVSRKLRMKRCAKLYKGLRECVCEDNANQIISYYIQICEIEETSRKLSRLVRNEDLEGLVAATIECDGIISLQEEILEGILAIKANSRMNLFETTSLIEDVAYFFMLKTLYHYNAHQDDSCEDALCDFLASLMQNTRNAGLKHSAAAILFELLSSRIFCDGSSRGAEDMNRRNVEGIRGTRAILEAYAEKDTGYEHGLHEKLDYLENGGPRFRDSVFAQEFRKEFSEYLDLLKNA